MHTIIKRLVVAYPSGNTTAIVIGEQPSSDPTPIERKSLNLRIIEAWEALHPDLPRIEQCCFLTAPRNPSATGRCEMFGGEFCGNAARSVAWILADGENREGTIEVSGVDHPLAFSVRQGQVSIEMPVPELDNNVVRTPEGILVRLDGITHLVVTGPQAATDPRRLLHGLVRDNCYGFADQPAVGVCRYDPESGEARFCIRVREVDSIFDETACGSGTCAIGMAVAWERSESVELEVIQPSGERISVSASYSAGRIGAADISGPVRILYDGELRLR
jgi:diaminopimelate epimerase